MARRRKSSVGPFGEWQPLSFRQLATLLAILVMGVVLLPVGVRAAGQLISIVDSDSDTDQAQVDSGKLRVGDGAGPLTVNGTVIEGVPTGLGTAAYSVPPNTEVRIAGPFPATSRFALGSLTYFGVSTTTRAALIVRDTVSGLCNSSGTVRAGRAIADLPVGGTLHLPFPVPLTAPFGTATPNSWCLFASSTGGSYIVLPLGRTV